VKLSATQLHCLAALDPETLRQYPDIRAQGVAWSTLASLCQPRSGRPALAQRVDLKPAAWLKAPYHVFYRLTPDGAAARPGAQA